MAMCDLPKKPKAEPKVFGPEKEGLLHKAARVASDYAPTALGFLGGVGGMALARYTGMPQMINHGINIGYGAGNLIQTHYEANKVSKTVTNDGVTTDNPNYEKERNEVFAQHGFTGSDNPKANYKNLKKVFHPAKNGSLNGILPGWGKPKTAVDKQMNKWVNSQNHYVTPSKSVPFAGRVTAYDKAVTKYQLGRGRAW
jgi:hypothetical protein